MADLTALLGAPPAPQGTWEAEALLVTAAARTRGGDPEELAASVRELPGVSAARSRPNGFVEIALARPGEIVNEILATPPSSARAAGVPAWPDSPRTWDNPGFVVRYACVRAGAVQRWAAELGVAGEFRPETLTARQDRAVLRVLAEIFGRRMSRDPAWPAYLIRLATACHDAFEQAHPLPKGPEPVTSSHVARVRLARAARHVLREGLSALGEDAPERL
jgi:hypothetical protein